MSRHLANRGPRGDVSLWGDWPGRDSYACRMSPCASCGQENPTGAGFCNACGAPLTADAPAGREERKVVTVLFADVVGFTARAERMDPEDVRRFLQPLQARLRSELERRGGTVEKFIGDAVMAVFGAPVAHEDDPERAVRAALAIIDALAEDGDVEVRIGITTGEALVALGARPEVGEGIASGDVVNTASRLQAAAPTGGILVDETTWRATGRAIEFAAAAPVLAKGKAEPVPAWRALRARSRVGVDRPGGAPLVGRVQELSLLRATLARVRSERKSQLVTLVGVPGIGKSRLVFELFKEVERDGQLVYWHPGRSLPYGEGVTFWALGEIVKAHCGIFESDPPARRRRSCAAPSRWSSPSRRRRPGSSGTCGRSRGRAEELGAGDLRSEAFAAWRRFLEALAEQRPLVARVRGSALGRRRAARLRRRPARLGKRRPAARARHARPELLDSPPGWGGGKVELVDDAPLSPLSDADTPTLVRAQPGRSLLRRGDGSRLLDRAGGNPLYAREYARILTDRGPVNVDAARDRSTVSSPPASTRSPATRRN